MRGAVNQALSRLARSRQLMRIRHGVYMRRTETRLGMRARRLQWSQLAAQHRPVGEAWAQRWGCARWLECPLCHAPFFETWRLRN